MQGRSLRLERQRSIDGGGVVRYIYQGSNQFDRASVELVMAAARPLTTSG